MISQKICIRQDKFEHLKSHAESLRRKEKPDKTLGGLGGLA
jgi:hypothetical protein